MFSLPLRYGGLGIPLFSELASQEFLASKRITAPLAAIMTMQGNELPDPLEVAEAKKNVKSEREQQTKQMVTIIEESLPENTARSMKQAAEKGSSSWLSVIPLAEQGFTLNKGEFRDAISLRYDRPMADLPSKCPCGQNFDANHALNCKRGGFIIMRHNNVRDFEANLLRKVCHDVEVEPPLQPLDGETATGLIGDEARPDIRAKSFWRPCQNAFFDIRVTNSNTASQAHLTAEQIFARHKGEKKRNYNDRVINIEHGTFTPLIFSISGGVGPEAAVFHKHIAERITEKSGDRYNKVMTWIRCKLSFIILRACLTCIRGSRQHKIPNATSVVEDFSFACGESQMDT